MERTVTVKGINGLKQRVDNFLYCCEYIKDCEKITPQCRSGGNSYCGEYKKRLKKN